MMTIWKYEVGVTDQWHEIGMPAGSSILHVGSQGDPGVVAMWVEVPFTDAELEGFEYRIFGTGQELPSPGWYVGTAVVPGLPLVWHVYRRMPQGEGP
jgi:hypothetical protein